MDTPVFFHVMWAVGMLVWAVMIIAPIGIWISTRAMANQLKAQNSLLARALEKQQAERPLQAHDLSDLSRSSGAW